MISKRDFKKINDWLWEVPKDFRNDMRVPARTYLSLEMLEDAFRDRSISQLVNVATLPGIVGYSIAMPDMHEGYGFPIGGVAAMKIEDGVISPGGVGYDINCGMKLLASECTEKELKPYLEKLAAKTQEEVPSGLGRGRERMLDIFYIEKILKGGAGVVVEEGEGEEEDLKNCESGGNLSGADPSLVSDHAKRRGRDQVGTLGSGNHFLEIQKVAEIFDEDIANTFGLFRGQVVVMIHTGSRGLGHQIATDYIKVMMKAMPKYGIKLPDRELAACPVKSAEGQRYLSAMACGANYAWANRQRIAHFVRKSWKAVLGDKPLRAVYDVAHNIAKIEKHKIKGKERELCLHRKGATRAFPPNHPEIPEKYKKSGQPVLVPGSMGTASYILAGVETGKDAFYSTNHGAGRRMSRKEAARRVSGQEVVKELGKRGIIVKCQSFRGIGEEAPLAYKDIGNVVEVVHQAGLSKKVAKVVPLAVIKGE